MNDIPIKEEKYRYNIIRSTSYNLVINETNLDMRLQWKPLGPIVIEKRGLFFPEIYYLQTMVRYDNDNSER